MIRLIIADDHQLIREGLRKVLRDERDMKIVADVSNTQELLELLRKEVADVLILDVNMPGRSGIDVLADLKKEFSSLKILMLSMHPEDALAIRALKSGAQGYITKNSSPDEMINAIRKVGGGRRYISEALADKLADNFQSNSQQELHHSLSDREFEVFQLLGSGVTVSEIAVRLSLSVPTVSTYRARILEKMKMDTTAELIHYAVKNNLVE
ncbi:MAG: response regulator transcription factor [Bacteroidota bacterium]